MLKKERIQILDLLSKGHIDAVMAEKLLNALDLKEEVIPVTNKFKQLIIKIESSQGDDVNIKIPLEFAKLLKTKNFSSNLGDYNLDIDHIIELANSGVVGEILNIDVADGTKIIIKVE